MSVQDSQTALANKEISEAFGSIPRQHAQIKWFVHLYLIMVFGLLTYAGFFASRLEKVWLASESADLARSPSTLLARAEPTTVNTSRNTLEPALYPSTGSSTVLGERTENPGSKIPAVVRPGAFGYVYAAIVGVAFGILTYGLGMILLAVLGRRISTLYFTYRHITVWRRKRLDLACCTDVIAVFPIHLRAVQPASLVGTVPVSLFITNALVLLGSSLYFIGPVFSLTALVLGVMLCVSLMILISPRVWMNFDIPLQVLSFADTITEADRYEKDFTKWMKGGRKGSRARRRGGWQENIALWVFIIAIILAALWTAFALDMLAQFSFACCIYVLLARGALLSVRLRRRKLFKAMLKRQTDRRNRVRKSGKHNKSGEKTGH